MALHYFTPRARTRGTEGTRGTEDQQRICRSRQKRGKNIGANYIKRAKWADQVAATFQLPQVPGDINTATEDRVDIAINRPSTIPGIAFSPSATSVQANRLFRLLVDCALGDCAPLARVQIARGLRDVRELAV
jgi:hypothetical protein